MRTIDVPGGTASFREEHELRTRDSRLLEVTEGAAAPAFWKMSNSKGFTAKEYDTKALMEAGLTEAEYLSVYRVRDAKIISALASWSLPIELPTMDTLGDLPPKLYEALATATDPITVVPVDFDPHPDRSDFQSTPMPPSDGSVTVSRADQEPVATSTQQSSQPSSDFADAFPV
jgi:hypothetical protein